MVVGVLPRNSRLNRASRDRRHGWRGGAEFIVSARSNPAPIDLSTPPLEIPAPPKAQAIDLVRTSPLSPCLVARASTKEGNILADFPSVCATECTLES